MELTDLQHALKYSDAESSKKALNALLPSQQKTRSYGSEEIKSKKLLCSLSLFKYIVQKDRLFIHMSVDWMIGSQQKQETTSKEMEEFANDFLIDNSNGSLKDWETIRIAVASTSIIIYEWNIEKWLQLNFSSEKPYFKLPATFYFKISKGVPTFISSRVGKNDLLEYISEMFNKWIDKKNKESLFKNDSTSFLKKIEMILFITKVDLQKSEIRVSLRQSVIIGGFLAANAIKNKSSMDKDEIKDIKTTISKKVSSVSRLDRFIRGL